MNLNLPLLSIITFLPLVGGLVLLLLPGVRAQKWWTLLVTFVTFAVSLLLFVFWRNGEAGMQFMERLPWVPQFNIQYFLAVAFFSGIFTDVGGPAYEAVFIDILPQEKRASGFGIRRVAFNLASAAWFGLSAVTSYGVLYNLLVVF